MNWRDILTAVLAHLQISFLGVLAGVVVGIPLASFLKNKPRTARFVMVLVDIIQTIPTLAMLTFLMLFLGLNDRTVIVAIFLYALFPIVRNTYTGITGVEPAVIKTGLGLGMTRWQIYYKLEFPLALPVILTGLRLAIISALGITTTGILIGAGGLGMLIWRGIQTRNTVMMLSGAIPVSLLAVFFDILLTHLEKRRSRGQQKNTH